LHRPTASRNRIGIVSHRHLWVRTHSRFWPVSLILVGPKETQQ
jgi:hypothetical protein